RHRSRHHAHQPGKFRADALQHHARARHQHVPREWGRTFDYRRLHGLVRGHCRCRRRERSPRTHLAAASRLGPADGREQDAPVSVTEKKMPDPTDKDIAAWIDAVNEESEYLSEWERQFMLDITEQWHRMHSLTDAQLRVLETLYDRI